MYAIRIVWCPPALRPARSRLNFPDSRYFVAGVREGAVELTVELSDVERYDTELDARCAACYLPQGTEYRIVKMGY